MMSAALCAAMALASTQARPSRDLIGEPRKVLLIDIDDVGQEFLDEASADGWTPNLDRLQSGGMVFINFWAAPMCSVARARVLTGLEAYRPGNLVGTNYKPDTPNEPAPSGQWITDGMPGTRTKRGKWHLSSLPTFPVDVCGPGGFQAFSGMRGNLNWDGTGYYDWGRWYSDDIGHAYYGQSSVHNTTQTAREILIDLSNRTDFISASFTACHGPVSLPPDGEPLGHVYDPSLPPLPQILHHLDYWLGVVVDHAVELGYVVIVWSDNGSKYKFTYKELGINTPMFVVGLGVPQGLTTRLVQATDLWSTVRYLRGMVPSGAADSMCFADAFLDVPAWDPPREYNTCVGFSALGVLPPHSEWTEAVRDARYKLIVHADPLPGQPPVPDEAYDLFTDPGEQYNLLPHSPLPSAIRELYAHLP